VRSCRLKREAEPWWYKFLISRNKRLRLYTMISHEPIISGADQEKIDRGETTRSQIAEKQQVKDTDGENYIDEFGRYVYLQTAIGDSEDMDLRYDVPDPELFPLQYIAQ
jgi:DNA-binding transcriptional MocR family regulator